MFKKLLKKIAFSLDNNSVPYMIIGGQAVLLYGEPRLTRDIDITLGVSIDKLDDLLKIIKETGLTPLPENLEDFVKKTFVLPAKDDDTGIRVDFIFSQTAYENQAIKIAKSIIIEDSEISFASLEDMIIHKVFSGRPRDLEDARSILLKNPEFDKDYVIKWLKEFDDALGQNKFLDTFNILLDEIIL